MKKVIILIVGVMITVQLNAQDAISKFFNKYESDTDFTHVSITSRMFGLFTNMEMQTQEDQEIMDAISKLKGLKILAKNNTTKGKELYKEAFTLIPKTEYDELMSVRDEDRDMKFMIKEKNGKISELLMVMGGDKEFFILSLFGEIDLKQISKISRAMDIDGLDKLQKLDDKKKGN
ncbi:hypothetical protein C900_02644 [Fulvivirga imtechensis AK7]|uniref:DUF4252 domain-containing protein n=1 Tax=Fulvivirga imtechensis AK7 TaxID=1237149 RepID=L8K0V9_9BACT|nr:DUF4252 domain-containing protein [Fulvivirga imtechensis]ELR73559.1 hypothetical protein C900_02644 [Fulvivirga imtechensis AK7]